MHKKIKLARSRLGLTQLQLAKKIRVSQSTIGHIETDRKKPGTKVLLRLAKALKLAPGPLIKALK